MILTCKNETRFTFLLNNILYSIFNVDTDDDLLCPWIENLRMLQESNNDALKTDAIHSQNVIDNINNNSETQEGGEGIETLETNSTS